MHQECPQKSERPAPLTCSATLMPEPTPDMHSLLRLFNEHAVEYLVATVYPLVLFRLMPLPPE